MRHDVADFTDESCTTDIDDLGPYQRALPELIRVAEEAGWLGALEQVIRPIPDIGEGMFRYVTDESKGDLVCTLNMSAAHTVVDFGCGLGPVSVAIARRAEFCYAIDVCHEQAVFALQRCRQMGYTNVCGICAGDDMKIPLADTCIDTIVMNGVLEWVGCSRRFPGPPEEAQASILREAHRVLQPKGCLYVSTKNRFALLHLLGSRSDHMGKVPWLGLLHPRIRNVIAFGRQKDAGDRIHGIRAYRRLFETAGFRARAVYAVMPTFRHPKRFIPLNERSPIGFKGRGASLIYNRRLEAMAAMMIPAFWLKHLVYCFGFVLEKR